jgi:hypothetical protein
MFHGMYETNVLFHPDFSHTVRPLCVRMMISVGIFHVELQQN